MKKGTRRKVNKSQAVRDYVASNPSAKPKDVAAALGSKGIKISPQSVSTIKYTMKKKGGAPLARRRGRPSAGGTEDMSALLEAKKLADSLGGIDRAKRALDMLAKLQ